ncbi:DUF3718 domain-containing protein [Lacimicrobium sp. SS2-24]|uniref:DUF3718 domain-containing protein n=1 Tax=Lacimicrobium sp. SS2-24 TaxID=2005569 RepID=UPI000B4A6E61|nr:DUF3718 domain-containing protein [Lacimicrobium sp. SS2-24]
MKTLTLITSVMTIVPMLSVASVKTPVHKTHSSHSADQAYQFTGDLMFSGFCKAVIHNDVSMLRRNVGQQVGRVASTSRGVYRTVLQSDGVTCAGEDLLTFSQSRQAKDVLAYLQQQANRL